MDSGHIITLSDVQVGASFSFSEPYRRYKIPRGATSVGC